jgi:membrane-associated protease RseP (regulator of RpoE activity)
MKYFSRPYQTIGVAALLGLTMGWAAAPPGALAQTTISHILQEINPLLSHTQGYLGVLVSDVDPDTANKLKLKDVRGAVITLIDHDAPAGQIGLHVNDVVVSVNGQAVEGAEQFGRMMREIPAGHKVELAISRDGAPQTITVQLVDRKKMEHDVWNKMNNPDAFPPPPSGMGLLPGGGDGLALGHVSPFGSSLNVGALVEPLTSQMADYLGVQSGIMVKQVTRKSEAANAGLRAFDIVLKVGNDNIQTTADWDRALRSNAGKQVQVTILRDRKQQVINLQVDSKHHSQVEWTDIFPQEECPEMAALDQDVLSQDWQELAESLSQQAQNFRSPFTEQQMEELQRQAEKMRDSFKTGTFPDFKVDPKQMEELRKEMEQFRQGFSADQFKIDPKQMEEFRRQMDQFRKSLPQNFQFERQQLDRLRRQLEQMRELNLGLAA